MEKSLYGCRVGAGERACSRVNSFWVFPERDGALQKETVRGGLVSVLVKSSSVDLVPPIQTPPARAET
jgi:hypothetical protein